MCWVLFGTTGRFLGKRGQMLWEFQVVVCEDAGRARSPRGEEGRARGIADRRLAVGVLEGQAAVREPPQVGRASHIRRGGRLGKYGRR